MLEADKRKSLYIETTIPSYATAWDSTDIIKYNRQIITRAFWKDERHRFRLYTSRVAFEECGKGDPDAAAKRLEFLNSPEIKNILQTDADIGLAADYRKILKLPERAKQDADHLAVCVIHKIDFLLTWNCVHLGPASQEITRIYNEKHGLWTPKLVTPETITEIIALEDLK